MLYCRMQKSVSYESRQEMFVQQIGSPSRCNPDVYQCPSSAVMLSVPLVLLLLCCSLPVGGSDGIAVGKLSERND